MKKSERFLQLAMAILLGFPLLAHAADAKHGGEVYAEACADCHSVKEGKAKKGPSMFGIVGRQAGTVADFNYSDAMRQSKLSWAPDQLSAFLKAPKQKVPGTKMKLDGDLNDAEIADLIAYLSSLH
ncbi:c-type cytochrome [Uliginosibacterium gangwonense]|uniref:c-type cytochrome n=1 Tax=Uliginosibacterium gangwonense TaxID=392736 RepID=UPI00036F0C78|nr:c-type cytochrome [Uliginosibacterium gangwonense]